MKLVAAVEATKQERLALILIAEMLLQIIRLSANRDDKKRREHNCDRQKILRAPAHRRAF